MGNIKFSVYFFGGYRRLASIIFAVIFLSALNSVSASNTKIPHAVHETFAQVNTGNTIALKNEIDVIENSVQASRDPIKESRQFLDAFINEMNHHYGLNLNLQEACRFVRGNLQRFDLPPKERDALVVALDLLEQDRSNALLTIQGHPEQCLQYIKIAKGVNIYWPWEWSWFGLNKQPSSHKRLHNLLDIAKAAVEVELPSSCYFGLCELFAGALLFLVPNPTVWGAGIAMMGDGTRRLADGVIQLGEERRLDPNFTPPDIAISPTRK